MPLKKRLVLHTCCATCLCYVYELLEPSYTIAVYYYNPNISPEYEFHKRLRDVETFCSMKGLDLYVGDYDNARWKDIIFPFRFHGERSERCSRCFETRFESTFEYALKYKADIVSTTLTIGPHKDTEKINSIGRDLSGRYGIPFLEADFKKDGGFRKASELSAGYGFYRQNYCGCIYSKMERAASAKKRS